MSKFFAQMLISVVLGVSAAVGFSPDVRGEVEGTFREAEAFAHALTRSVFEAAANVEANTDVSAEASMGVETDLDLVPNASVDASVSAESETDAEVESDAASLGLENSLEAILDLGVGIGE